MAWILSAARTEVLLGLPENEGMEVCYISPMGRKVAFGFSQICF